MKRSKIARGLRWLAPLCFGSALTGMISAGEPTVFTVTVLLLGILCIWVYVLFTNVHTTRRRLRVCIGIGILLLVILPKPIVGYLTRSEIRKTLSVSIINSDGSTWEGLPSEESFSVRRFPLTTLKAKFVKGNPYPLVLTIGHDARQAFMWGSFTLWFRETVEIRFPQEQQEWRQQKSKKPGCLAYKHNISQLYRSDSQRKLWPIPSFVFPAPGQYNVEYEIDALGQDYNEHSIDVGILRGRFSIELYE